MYFMSPLRFLLLTHPKLVFLQELLENHPSVKDRLAKVSREKDKYLTKIGKRSYIDKKEMILIAEQLLSEHSELDEEGKQELIRKILDDYSSTNERLWTQVVKSGTQVLSNFMPQSVFSGSRTHAERTVEEHRSIAKTLASQTNDPDFLEQLQRIADKHPQLSALMSDTIDLAREYLQESLLSYAQELVSNVELALSHTYRFALQDQIDLERRCQIDTSRRTFLAEVKSAYCDDIEG